MIALAEAIGMQKCRMLFARAGTAAMAARVINEPCGSVQALAYSCFWNHLSQECIVQLNICLQKEQFGLIIALSSLVFHFFGNV